MDIALVNLASAAERILPICAVAAMLCGCGDSSGRGGCSRGDGSDVHVKAAEDCFNRLLESAVTNVVCYRLAEGSSNRVDRIEADYDTLYDSVMKISDAAKRIRLMETVERELTSDSRTFANAVQELNHFNGVQKMADALVAAIWDTCRDEKRILEIWKRQDACFMHAAMRCEEEFSHVFEELKPLEIEYLRVQLEISRTKMSDLSEEDRKSLRECQERLPQLRDRAKSLIVLYEAYVQWDIGERGRALNGGRLYRVFREVQKKEVPRRRIPQLPLGSVVGGVLRSGRPMALSIDVGACL